MIMLEPLLTCHALSGAVRPVTPGLLGEIYLAPRTDTWPLAARVADGPAPWTASFAVAPTETALAVERALRALICNRPLKAALFVPVVICHDDLNGRR